MPLFLFFFWRRCVRGWHCSSGFGCGLRAEGILVCAEGQQPLRTGKMWQMSSSTNSRSFLYKRLSPRSPALLCCILGVPPHCCLVTQDRISVWHLFLARSKWWSRDGLPAVPARCCPGAPQRSPWLLGSLKDGAAGSGLTASLVTVWCP